MAEGVEFSGGVVQGTGYKSNVPQVEADIFFAPFSK